MAQFKGAEKPAPGTTPGRRAQRESWNEVRATGPTNQLGLLALLGPSALEPKERETPAPPPPPPPRPPSFEHGLKFPHVKIFDNVVEFLRVLHPGFKQDVADIFYAEVQANPREHLMHLWEIEGYLIYTLEQSKENPDTRPERKNHPDQLRAFIRATSWFSHPRYTVDDLKELLRSFAAEEATTYDRRRPDSNEKEKLYAKLEEIESIRMALATNTLGKDLLPQIELLEKWIEEARRKFDRLSVLRSTDSIPTMLQARIYEPLHRPRTFLPLLETPDPIDAADIRKYLNLLRYLRPLRDELLFRYLYPETMRSMI